MIEEFRKFCNRGDRRQRVGQRERLSETYLKGETDTRDLAV